MATYYVSTTGSDSNGGSIASPFGSLQHAHDLAQPGDTIYLRGGVYRLTEGINLTNDGTSSNPITVANYPGEAPVLDGSGMSSGDYYGSNSAGGWIMSLASSSGNHISGLELKNGPMGGLVVWGASNNNVIEQLNVHNNGRLSEWEGKGISLYGSSANNLFLNNDSHHNQDLNLTNADGFQIATTGSGNVLRGNRAYANSDDGFDFYNIADGTKAGAVVLDGNWAYGNGFDSNGNPAGDGNGFKLGGQRSGSGSTSGGHTLTDNVSWDNRAIGFDQNDANTPLTLHNNTAYDNGLYNYGIFNGQNTLVNNAAFGTGKISAAGNAHDNSWNLASGPTTADFMSLDDSSALGGRMADGSLPTSDFLHLSANSKLIDKGVDVGLSYSGTAPDLGAHEYGAAQPSQPSSPPSSEPPSPPSSQPPSQPPSSDPSSSLNVDGTKKADTLVSTSAHEVFTGKGGADTFVFTDGFGDDTILDFRASGARHDVIDLSDVSGINSFEQLKAHAVQGGNDLVITTDHHDTLTLTGLTTGDLRAVDFLF
jgi:hypothetical protein